MFSPAAFLRTTPSASILRRLSVLVWCLRIFRYACLTLRLRLLHHMPDSAAYTGACARQQRRCTTSRNRCMPACQTHISRVMVGAPRWTLSWHITRRWRNAGAAWRVATIHGSSLKRRRRIERRGLPSRSCPPLSPSRFALLLSYHLLLRAHNAIYASRACCRLWSPRTAITSFAQLLSHGNACRLVCVTYIFRTADGAWFMPIPRSLHAHLPPFFWTPLPLLYACLSYRLTACKHACWRLRCSAPT